MILMSFFFDIIIQGIYKDLIDFFNQNRFAIHLFNKTNGHLSRPKPFYDCLFAVRFQFFFEFWLIISFL